MKTDYQGLLKRAESLEKRRCVMEKEQPKRSMLVESIYIGVVVILLVGMLASLTRDTEIRKHERDSINKQWVEELDRRGIITLDKRGSFRWNNE